MQKFVDAAARVALRDVTAADDQKAHAQALARHCAAYRQPSNARAAIQILTTLVPFVALVATMIWLGESHPLAVLLLSIPVGGLLVRFFIIQHDCGHGSFVEQRGWNDAIGRCMSVLTVTPYGLWRRVHAQHHASSGNLDRRGAGDINTLTVKEYLALSPAARFRYRIYRNPLFLFLFAVPFFFTVIQRLPVCHPLPVKDAWKSVMGLNMAIAVVYGTLGYLVGLKLMLLMSVPAIIVASALGGWLFFIQHQFEDTHWEQGAKWDFQIAAVQGSSYYSLPPILNWFTGNIGLHHIHHLNSMIPNYRLHECLEASPEFQALNKISLFESLKCANLTLWDEDSRRLIGFADVRVPQAA